MRREGRGDGQKRKCSSSTFSHPQTQRRKLQSDTSRLTLGDRKRARNQNSSSQKLSTKQVYFRKYTRVTFNHFSCTWCIQKIWVKTFRGSRGSCVRSDELPQVMSSESWAWRLQVWKKTKNILGWADPFLSSLPSISAQGKINCCKH